MKSASLFLLIGSGLLAGCNSSERQAEAAVSEYVSSGLGEPGYYRPEQFTMRPYTRKDSVAYEAQLAELTAAPADTTTFRDEAGRVLPRITAAVATSTKPSAKLAADAMPVGTYVRHTYREQSKSGRITRDSGEFVVYPNAQVVSLMPRHVREARLKQLQAQKP